jgi:hypothetical protein
MINYECWSGLWRSENTRFRIPTKQWKYKFETYPFIIGVVSLSSNSFWRGDLSVPLFPSDIFSWFDLPQVRAYIQAIAPETKVFYRPIIVFMPGYIFNLGPLKTKYISLGAGWQSFFHSSFMLHVGNIIQKDYSSIQNLPSMQRMGFADCFAHFPLWKKKHLNKSLGLSLEKFNSLSQRL